MSSHRRAFRVGPCTASSSADDTLPYLEMEYQHMFNAEYWSLRPVTVLKRGLEIGFAFSGWFIDTQLRKGDLEAISGAQAERLRKILVELGPAFVKIGQAVSSRPDIVPPSYTRELEKLQDRIPPFSDVTAIKIIQEELGRPISEVYSEFSTTSVAAASLGQVYKARVKKTGEEVAIKVQRPGVRESIALDIFIMRQIFDWLGDWRKLNTDLPSLLDEWASSLFRELDYRIEAANGTRFKQLYSHLEGVYVPDMMHELTTERVLTMEWLDGVRLRRAGDDASEGRLLDPEDMKLVGVGVQCSLEQMLEDGFYHADPHPGNLLRTKDGRLGYLDFGMMASINPEIRRGLIRATLHMVNREFQALANDFETLGLLPAGSDKDKVVPALTSVFEKALAGGVSEMSFGTLSGELGKTMYDFKFQIPPYYTLLVRSLSVLEGIALSSDPNYKVLGAAYPWVARRLLTDSSPELRETLRVLLYKGNRFQFSRLETLLRQALKSPSRVSRGAPPQPTGFQTDGKPLVFLLGPEGHYMRQLMAEELAKGIDAAWRLSTDNFMQDARSRLSMLFQELTTRERQNAESLPGGVPRQQPTVLPMAMMEILKSFPALADDTDSYQVEGITSLVQLMQEVNESSQRRGGPQGSQEALPGQVTEAVGMLQWFVQEAQTLPPTLRGEALRWPLAVGAKLSSRIAARALKGILRYGSSNGKPEEAKPSRVSRRSASPPPTRFDNGTIRPAATPAPQPVVGLGGDGMADTRPGADTAVSIPPGNDAAKSGLSTEGGGIVAPQPLATEKTPATNSAIQGPSNAGNGVSASSGISPSTTPSEIERADAGVASAKQEDKTAAASLGEGLTSAKIRSGLSPKSRRAPAKKGNGLTSADVGNGAAPVKVGNGVSAGEVGNGLTNGKGSLARAGKGRRGRTKV